MARKAQPPRSAPKQAPALPPPTGTDRDKIVAAFMALLAEKRFEQIGFGEIAARSGLTLANCRGEFGSTLAIYAAHVKQLDRKVLAGASGDMTEEPPRERLLRAIERCRFEELRKREEAHGFAERSEFAERFFREGRVGQWREVLSEAQVKRVVAAHRPTMQRHGYYPLK